MLWKRLTWVRCLCAGFSTFQDPACSSPVGQVGTGWECAAEPSGWGPDPRKGVEGKRWLANMCATDPEAGDQDAGAAPDRLGDLGGAGSVSGRRCAAPVYTCRSGGAPASSLFPAGLCQVGLRGLLPGEPVVGLRLDRRAQGDPEAKDAQGRLRATTRRWGSGVGGVSPTGRRTQTLPRCQIEVTAHPGGWGPPSCSHPTMTFCPRAPGIPTSPADPSSSRDSGGSGGEEGVFGGTSG